MRAFRTVLRTSAWTAVLAPALALSMVVAPLTLAPTQASAQIGLNITIAPPALPVYEPPPLPGPGYIFTPGYWNYGEAGYYFVPGVWVQPPRVGLLWTPGYWGYTGGVYAFNAGYWGPHVGFYGGINYGFGYGGIGFGGGEWRGGGFFYNTAAFGGGGRFFGGVHNTYVNNTVINNINISHTSFNGPGGVSARASAQEAAFQREQHVAPTAEQSRHTQLAAANPGQRFSANHGTPAVAGWAIPMHPGSTPARTSWPG